MPHRVSVSAAEARRIALAASGFDRERPANANDARHFRRVMATLKLLQLDFVNVLVPAHYLILWSRLGAYDRDRFHRFVYGRKTYTEQWAHEASIVPVDAWPLLRERRAGWQPRPNNPIVRMRGHRRYLDEVLQQVQSHGALTAHELPPVPGPKRKPGEWYRSIPRLALEYHFARGELCVERRLPTFQRVYDLTERIVPAPHYTGVFDADDAARELLRRSAQALGVATASDLADYFRMSPRVAAPRIAELVEIGELLEVRVEGWPVPGYLHAAARSPRRIDACSLLSPFDPVVWYRPRAERLFDFHYRIEIYVPQAKRRYGYYVLPFLLGDRIVGRVDLKADRAAGTLRVCHAYAEDGIDEPSVVKPLADELCALGRWLDLATLEVNPHNAFARELERESCRRNPL